MITDILEMAGASGATNGSPALLPPVTEVETVLVGFDFGANQSCLLAGSPDATDVAVSKVIPTVVGYVKDGIVAGAARILCGEEALRARPHVKLVAPFREGIIADPAAARDFLKRVRTLADPTGTAEIRAVVGLPAKATDNFRDDVRRCAQGIFDRILLLPEPFLAALGYREDSRVGQSDYVDPVANSLFIDIGGGTSDLCLVQGDFPAREDQISIPFAGDAIDELMHEELDRTYQNNGLTLELGDVIDRACHALVDKIYPALTTLIARSSPDSVVMLLQNIIVTGGGAQVRGLDTVLRKKLSDDGYESAKVKLAGQDFQRYVVVGALKAARENQWEILLN